MKRQRRATPDPRGAARQLGVATGRGNLSDTPPPPSRGRRPVRRWWLVVGYLLLGGALAVGARQFQRARTPAATAWDRAQSPEEARLLRAALARPADAAAQAALGHYYVTARRAFEAAWALQRARDAAGGPHSTGDDLLLGLTEALEGGGLRGRALALLSEPGAAAPGSAAVVRRRAELQLRLGRAAEAATTLRPLVSESPNAQHPTSNTLLLFGRALEAAGDAAALAQYRRAVAADRHSAAAQLRLGRLLVQRGELAAGRTALEAARRLAPGDPEPPYLLGVSYLAGTSAEPEPAARWLNEALRVSPTFAPAHLALGRLALARRQWKEATEQFELALRSDRRPEALLGLADVLTAAGSLSEARQRRGFALALLGKLPQALAEFRALKAADPSSRTAAIQISQVLIQMSRSAEAAREVEPVAARSPRDWDLKQRLAQLYIDSLARDAARRLCEEWQRQDPGAATPLWLLGRIASYSPDGRAQAIDLYERALRLNPRDPEINDSLAQALSRPGPRSDPGRSLYLMGQAIALAPREASYHLHLGLLLSQLGRIEPARQQFLQALDRDPHLTAALVALVQIAGKLGETGQVTLFAPVIREQQEAERDGPPVRQATYRSPSDPTTYAALARYLAEQGELQAALAQWEVVLSLKPGDAAARREVVRLSRVLDRL